MGKVEGVQSKLNKLQLHGGLLYSVVGLSDS